MEGVEMTVRFDKFEEITPRYKYAGYITSPTQEWPWPHETDEMNHQILTDFYGAVEWLLSQGWDEYHELCSNTINPAQQHAFLPLREFRTNNRRHKRNRGKAAS